MKGIVTALLLLMLVLASCTADPADTTPPEQTSAVTTAAPAADPVIYDSLTDAEKEKLAGIDVESISDTATVQIKLRSDLTDEELKSAVDARLEANRIRVEAIPNDVRKLMDEAAKVPDDSAEHEEITEKISKLYGELADCNEDRGTVEIKVKAELNQPILDEFCEKYGLEFEDDHHSGPNPIQMELDFAVVSRDTILRMAKDELVLSISATDGANPAAKPVDLSVLTEDEQSKLKYGLLYDMKFRNADEPTTVDIMLRSPMTSSEFDKAVEDQQNKNAQRKKEISDELDALRGEKRTLAEGDPAAADIDLRIDELSDEYKGISTVHSACVTQVLTEQYRAVLEKFVAKYGLGSDEIRYIPITMVVENVTVTPAQIMEIAKDPEVIGIYYPLDPDDLVIDC